MQSREKSPRYFSEDKRNIPRINAANTCQLPDRAAAHKTSMTQKSRGMYNHQSERGEIKTAFVHVGLEHSSIKQTRHECQHGFPPNKTQSHMCGRKENGLTDFRSWKKRQEEKRGRRGGSSTYWMLSNSSQTCKAVRRCGPRIRVHRGVFAFSQHSAEQQHSMRIEIQPEQHSLALVWRFLCCRASQLFCPTCTEAIHSHPGLQNSKT